MRKKVTDSTSRFSRLIKPALQWIRYPKEVESKIILIMGCQRSGTTLLTRVFDSFKFCRVFSKLSSDDPQKIRLNVLTKVTKVLNHTRAPLIVLKPLVESHRANELKKEIKNSTTIWIFRNYLDVALSGIKHFPNTAGHGNLKPIIEEQVNNWRSEGLIKETTELAKDLYHQKLTSLDCACLFWYVRNSLFFQQHLDSCPDNILWKYEDLMFQPQKHFDHLSDKLQMNVSDYPFNETFSLESIDKNRNVKINVDIKKLCDGMLERLITAKSLTSSHC